MNLPKTVVEEIFSRTSGLDAHAGNYLWATPDLVYLHDVLGPLTLSTLNAISNGKIKYKGNVVTVNDHIYPPKDSASSNNINIMNQFAKRSGWNILPFGEGIEHTLLIENGTIKPGMMVVGTDSHTVTAGAAASMGIGLGSTDIGALLAIGSLWFKVPDTFRIHIKGEKTKFLTGKDIILKILQEIGVNGANYMAMEFQIDRSVQMNEDDDLAMANMTMEGGAKTCIILNENSKFKSKYEKSSEENAKKSLNMDITNLEPQIAAPYSPGNVKNAKSFEGTKVDQVYIGNCANGTISDLREAASILKGSSVNRNVKMIVIPATRQIFKQAIKEGLIDIFLDAGATVGPSTCGACAGLHMGVLAKDETCITNINRNFRGRMGDPTSKVYLSNSYVAAASAIEGKITVPGD
jgi:3-isopropylmalate/(R)-2-methylmalate dehydratase large subunit